MKRLLIPCCLLALAFFCVPRQAASQDASQFGFLPFGFYQPYGGTYGTSLKTPPYFALNPPVYYGTRHARPYGLSPFASPPMVTAGENYQSRLRVQFQQPRVATPSPVRSGGTRCNPSLEDPSTIIVPETLTPGKATQASAIGSVQLNPFVTDDKDLVNN